MDPDAQDSMVTSSGDILKKDKRMINAMPNPGRPKDGQKQSVVKKNVKESAQMFSWLNSFQTRCQSFTGHKCMNGLLNLIDYYTEYSSKDVGASYSKPNKAAKMKRNLIETLNYFHSNYLNIKTALDEPAYMDKMSILMTMYVDMEIKASRRGKESVQRITSKLITALFLFLNNFLGYILDTLLRIRFAVKSFREICIPIFRRVAKSLETPDDLTYVRCLLMFKIWKRLLPTREERNRINRLAVATLNPPPPSLLLLVMRGFFGKVLPKLPEGKRPDLVTRYYMTTRFNVNDSITEFLKISAEYRANELEIDLLTSSTYDDEPPEQENINHTKNKEDDLFLESVWNDVINCPSPVFEDFSELDAVFSDSSMSEIKSKSKCSDSDYKSKPTKFQKRKRSEKVTDLVISKSVKRKDRELMKKIKKNKLDPNASSVGGKSKNNLMNKNINNFPSWHIPIKHSSKLCSDKDAKNTFLESDRSFHSSAIRNSKSSDKNSVLDAPEKMPALDISDEKKNKFQGNENNVAEEDLKLSTNSDGITSKNNSKNKITISCKKFSEISSFSDEDLNLRHRQLLLDDAQLSSTEPSLKPEQTTINPQSLHHNVALGKIYEPPKTVSNSDLDKSSHEACETEDSTGGKTIETENIFDSTLEVIPSTTYKTDEVNKFLSKPNISDISKESAIDIETHVKNTKDCKGIENYSVDIEEPPAVSSSEISLPTEIQLETPDTWASNGEKINQETLHPSKTTDLIANPTTSNQDAKIESISSDCTLKVTAEPTYKSNHSIENLLSPKATTAKSEKLVNSCEFEHPLTESKTVIKKELISTAPDHRFRSIINEPQPICTVKVAPDASKPLKLQPLSNRIVLTKGQLKGNAEQHSPLNIGMKQRLSSETNSCLLHRILGEGDCLTNPPSECLMENRNVVNSITDGISAENPPVKRMKQNEQWEGSSDSVKNEDEYDFRTFDCMEEKKAYGESRRRNASIQPTVEQDFRASSVDIDVPMMGDTEYRYTSNNMTLNDSESEDSNLVIDEDVDSLKEQNEDESEGANLAVRSISDINDKLMHSERMLDKCEAGQREPEVVDNDPVNLRLRNLTSEISKENRVSENERNQQDLVSNPVTFDNRSPAVNIPPNLVSPCQLKIAKSMSKADRRDNAALPRQESLLLRPPIRTNQSGISTANVVKLVDLKALSANPASPKAFPPAALPQGNLTYISGSPLEHTHALAQNNLNVLAKTKYSNYHPVKTSLNKDSYIVIGEKVLPVKNTVILTPNDAARYESYYRSLSNLSLASNKNIQPSYEQVHQAKPVVSPPYQSLNKNLVVCEKTHSQPIASTPYQSPNQNLVALGKTRSLHPVASTPYQNANQNLIALGKTRSPQQVASAPYQSPNQNLVVPGKPHETHSSQSVHGPSYQSLNNNLALHEKTRLPLGSPTYIKSTVDYVKDKGGDYLKPNYVDQAYSSEQNIQRNLRSSELMCNKPHIPPDPLCLVMKSKEEDRREMTTEYEFSRFPVAQEVEVCSGTDSVTADWSVTGVSEIGDPDWPIDNEQNVDSCGAMGDPFIYPSSVGSDQLITENNQPFVNKPLDLQQVSVDFRHPEKFETNLLKEQFNMHVKTLEVDYNLCVSQLKFKEYYLAQVIPPSIPVPFPPQVRNDATSPVRCRCDQCSDNHAKLMSNYNLLMTIRNSKVKPYATSNDSHNSFCDKELSNEGDCSLPLKKRKTLTSSMPSEEPEMLSYPNTPMISIAQIADYSCQQQVMVPNPQSHWKDQADRHSPAYNSMHVLQGSSLQETILNRQTRLSKRKATKRRKTTRFQFLCVDGA